MRNYYMNNYLRFCLFYLKYDILVITEGKEIIINLNFLHFIFKSNK